MIVVIGADIADMGKSEGDDLFGIGGIGEDLLIAGQGGVEAHLALDRPFRAETVTFDHGSVGKDEHRRRPALSPGFAGHRRSFPVAYS